MGFYASVHQRLCVTRLVSFVVAQFAETNNVEHHVFIEFLPVVQGDLQHAVSRFRIVTIDVKDWQLRHTRNVSGIDCRASRFGRGCESDLIVDDDVNRPACAIAF